MVVINPSFCYNILCAALCPIPSNVTNGEVSYTGLTKGEIATYSCNSGFDLVGDVTITCTAIDTNTAVFLPIQTLQKCLRKLHN